MNTSSNRPALVSIIMPTHNCLEYLPKSVGSVLKQDFTDYELLIANDGSSDGSHAWLADLAKKDSRVRVLTLTGVGVSKARNLALSHCKGRYVAFIDADDYWYPGKLAHQIGFHVANPEVSLSFTNYLHVDPAGKTHGDCFSYWSWFNRRAHADDQFHTLEHIALAHIFAENVIGTSTVVTTKAALQNANGFDDKLRSASDWDLWLRIARQGGVGYSREIYADYLMRPGSISGNAKLRLEQMDRIIATHQRDVGKISPVAVARAWGRLATGYAEHYRAQHQPVRALLAHLKACALSPSMRVFRATADGALRLARVR